MESILKTELEGALLQSCSEVLGPLQLRLVDLDCRLGGRSLVRVFIERIAGEAAEPAPPVAGASLEDCTLASRALSPLLEADPRIPGAFDLEVSSPGLDRRLRLRADFEASLGGDVKLKLTESVEGRGANLTGRLARVSPSEVVVVVDKTEVSVTWNQIKQANRVWSFPERSR